jgi:hypothetical protein
MSEMREYWTNVYKYEAIEGRGKIWVGSLVDRDTCDRWLAHYRKSRCHKPLFRVHVRLKPEGAPKRYASEANRRAWEEDASIARWIVLNHGYQPEEIT